MNWNEIGKKIRKAKTDSLNATCAHAPITKHSKTLDLRISRIAGLYVNSYSYKHTQKILWEIRLRRSRAMEFIRRFQNR